MILLSIFSKLFLSFFDLNSRSVIKFDIKSSIILSCYSNNILIHYLLYHRVSGRLLGEISHQQQQSKACSCCVCIEIKFPQHGNLRSPLRWVCECDKDLTVCVNCGSYVIQSTSLIRSSEHLAQWHQLLILHCLSLPQSLINMRDGIIRNLIFGACKAALKVHCHKWKLTCALCNIYSTGMTLYLYKYSHSIKASKKPRINN